METRRQRAVNFPRSLTWTLRSLAALFAVIAMLVLSGVAFEAIASRSDATNLPPPGRLVDVGGFRLHLNCMGEGAPAVILDAGLGEASLSWSLVQPEIARSTTACAYDRAGMGWSDPSPHPRTPAVISAELHTLLANADIPRPYVLVAHSLAGRSARMLAIQQPSDVAGLVFVDVRHEYMDQIMTIEDREALLKAFDRQREIFIWARRLGVARAFGATFARQSGFPDETSEAMALLATRTSAISATNAEVRAYVANDTELRASSLGERPLILLVSRQSLTNIPHWDEAQRRQAALSSHSETRIAEESSHCIQCDEPQLVTAAVAEIVAEVRSR